MILLIGSAAYSPFRLDAINDAIAKLDPTLGPVTIDARWVYAIQEVADVIGAIKVFLRDPLKVREMGTSGHIRCCVRYNQKDTIAAYRQLFMSC